MTLKEINSRGSSKMKGIWTYSELLPSFEEDDRITLGEGNTPLIKSRRLGPLLGFQNLYFKLEIANPSGSYKDRFAAAAITELRSRNIGFCIATSSGNTGAALAAYCAAAGISCFLAVVDGAPSGKVQQMKVYGAKTLMIKDFGLDASVTADIMNGLGKLAAAAGGRVQISAYQYSPLGMSGVQTIAYEIAEEMSLFTGHVFSPSGGGGLTLAVAKGFRIWKEYHTGFLIPKVHCVQPEGNNTIAGPLKKGEDSARNIPRSTTSVSGLQVPNVIDGNETLKICRASGGTGHIVADNLVYECQEKLAVTEGIFCEPAGAVALAGAIQALKRGEIDPGDDVVCLVTGNGFKDPLSAVRIAKKTQGLFFDTPKETYRFIENEIENIK